MDDLALDVPIAGGRENAISARRNPTRASR
jgi:hypothetical protein